MPGAARPLAAAVAALLLAACRQPAPPPPAPPPVPPLTESQLPASGAVHFEIGAIEARRSDDGRDWLVSASVRNTGTRASRDLMVTVEGLDEGGTRIADTELHPDPQEIPPGGAASFVARLPGKDAIRTFHVEAIGR